MDSYTGRERDKFEHIPYKIGVTGSPVLEDVHSYAECEVLNAMDGGDMTTFLVSVVDGGLMSQEQWMTLAYFYEEAPPDWIAEYSKRYIESINNSLKIIDKIDYFDLVIYLLWFSFSYISIQFLLFVSLDILLVLVFS